MSPKLCLAWLSVPAVLLSMIGCDASVDRFPANELYGEVLAQREVTDLDPVAEDVAAVVQQWFGTPNEPRLPPGFPSGLISHENLARAAGPVSSDQQGIRFGLYRAQCVACHGVEGGGSGPAAAMQDPYPRDFRPGIFKYKSTTRGAKPTRPDLVRVLHRGIPGTGMPSFARLPPEDLEALVDYLIYLSIRGETERRLLDFAVTQLGYTDQPVAPEDRLLLDEAGRIADASLAQMLEPLVRNVAEPWLAAQEQIVALPKAIAASDPAADEGHRGLVEHDREAIQRGQALFHGPLANCASCHGQEGSGDAVTFDFDDWTKEYSTRLGIAPDDRAALRPFLKAGGLKPRPIEPRNLQWGVFRGGGDPATLYRRLVVGIEGTPMPGLLIQETAGTTGVTPEQVLDLVAYVRSLGERHGAVAAAEPAPGEAGARPGEAAPNGSAPNRPAVTLGGGDRLGAVVGAQ